MRITSAAGLQPDLGLSVTEAARRSQIIEATIATIGELGYAKASFARIMERAELSSSRMITYYFTTKAGLMQAVLSTVVGLKDSFLAERMGSEQDPGDALRRYIESEIAFLTARPDLARVLAEFAVSADPDGWAMAGPVLRDLRTGRLARQLRQGQREGAFGDFDPDVIAVAIAGAIDGVAAELARDPKLKTDRYANELANAFGRATQPVPRGRSIAKKRA